MNAYHIYVVGENPPQEFELITQIYSCINHRNTNPNIPLYLITDESSLSFFDSYNITKLYDDIITDIFDDYPSDKISEKYWASPKIWAMSKLKTPFVIYDIDLVLNKSLEPYLNNDLLYLHRETPSTYPNIYDVHHTDNFEWNHNFIECFKDTLPMNCAVVGMFNERFKNEYTNFYFDFVLNSNGNINYVNEFSKLMDSESAAQIMIEQWMLAALAYHWQEHKNILFQTKSFCNVIYTSQSLRLLDLDVDSILAHDTITSSMYHLWGAKKYQNKKQHKIHKMTKTELIKAEVLVLQSPYYDVIKESYYALIEKIK